MGTWCHGGGGCAVYLSFPTDITCTQAPEVLPSNPPIKAGTDTYKCSFTTKPCFPNAGTCITTCTKPAPPAPAKKAPAPKSGPPAPSKEPLAPKPAPSAPSKEAPAPTPSKEAPAPKPAPHVPSKEAPAPKPALPTPAKEAHVPSSSKERPSPALAPEPEDTHKKSKKKKHKHKKKHSHVPTPKVVSPPAPPDEKKGRRSCSGTCTKSGSEWRDWSLSAGNIVWKRDD